MSLPTSGVTAFRYLIRYAAPLALLACAKKKEDPAQVKPKPIPKEHFSFDLSLNQPQYTWETPIIGNPAILKEVPRLLAKQGKTRRIYG